MKNVRTLYKKTGRMKFISHLDMNRLMTRLLRKSALPVWYTEGFNKRVYISFALPLSLGFESDYEILDFKVLDDALPFEEVLNQLNRVSPEGIEFFDCFEPQSAYSDLAFADYTVTFDDGGLMKKDFENFLKSDKIMCEKKTKKGDIKTFDLKEKLRSFGLLSDGKNTVLRLTLPAGNSDNINPELLLKCYFESAPAYYCYFIRRTAVYDKDMRLFR